LKLIDIPEMVEILRIAGVTLTRAEEGNETLYVWADSGDVIAYVGKSASERRLKEELRWAGSCSDVEFSSGFARLCSTNGLTPSGFSYQFDQGIARSIVHDWHGGAIDDFVLFVGTANFSPTNANIEKLMIRIAVASGAVIANCSSAGLWDNQIGNPLDTWAQLAVCIHRSNLAGSTGGGTTGSTGGGTPGVSGASGTL
jgi:hypothetical protein